MATPQRRVVNEYERATPLYNQGSAHLYLTGPLLISGDTQARCLSHIGTEGDVQLGNSKPLLGIFCPPGRYPTVATRDCKESRRYLAAVSTMPEIGEFQARWQFGGR